jgi:hypothetical protein
MIDMFYVCVIILLTFIILFCFSTHEKFKYRT